MNLYKQIILKSEKVNWKDKKISSKLTFTFPVAKSHARYKKIKKYTVEFKSFAKFKLNKTDLILADQFLLKDLKIITNANKSIEPITSSEEITKTLNFAERILIKYFKKKINRVVAIGGGVILDLGSYIAEQMNTDLVLVPTTIIGMADASTGGKVRMNFVDGGRYIKHYYKSFYEPNKIIVDFDFLKTLNPKQISISLAETIKHAFAQSPKLLKYLLSDSFDPYNNFENLKTAVVWTSDLKRICLTVDPEETTNGSHKIIYLAHLFSNKIEEDNIFKVSHGEAVERGLLDEYRDNSKKLSLLKKLYDKLIINYLIK